MPNNNGSLLLGLDGVVVDSVQIDDDRTRTVHVLTGPDWVGVCPECRGRSSRSKGWVSTRPRDIKIGPDRPRIVWRKRKWLCTNMVCKRKRFTESVPAIPPRARVTVRAKAEMALAVLDDDRSVKAVAAAYGTTWNICHEAVKATADPVLAAEPGDVTVLGIDETRRGKAKWETCPDTGGRRWVDRWDTGLVDITGAGGLLVQVNGRAAQPVIDWLAPRDEQWKAGIKFVAIDMSATYAKAAREALPHAQLIVDRFHLVKRANEMLDTVRRRTTAAHRLRRGRKCDPEWINRRRLLRAAERLTDEQRHKLFEQAHVRRPQRRHRRRLDRQRATTRCVGLHRPWRTALRNLCRPIRVLRVLRCLLGARDPAAGRDDLQLAGTNDPGHSDRPVQRP